MWQVFYENGSTIREDSNVDWADIPKEDITAVRLTWDSFDWAPYFKNEFAIYQILFPGQEQWQGLTNLLDNVIKDYSIHREARTKSVGRSTAVLRKCIESIKNPVEQQYLAVSTKWHDEKDESARRKAIYLNNFLGRLKSLSSGIGSYQYQIEKGIVLRAEGRRVGFYQHKHHVTGMTKVFGHHLDEMYAQEIGMVYNKVGDFVYAEMDIKSGQIVSGINNVRKIGLNLELHGINLEELGG